MRPLYTIVLLAAISPAALTAGSIERARLLRQNGQLEEATKELAELAAADAATADERAAALLLLGEIAVDQQRFDGARESWSVVIEKYPGTPSATAAQRKLELLEQLLASVPGGFAPAPAAEPAPTHPPGTVLVLASNSAYTWAALAIAGTLKRPAAPFTGTLAEALAAARADPGVEGIVDVTIDVDSAGETVRAICYRPQGGQVWQHKTQRSGRGSKEQMARRMVERVAKRTNGLDCP